MRDPTQKELRAFRERMKKISNDLAKTRSSMVVMSLGERVKWIQKLIQEAANVTQELTNGFRESLREDVEDLEEMVEKAEEARIRFLHTLSRLE